jgi:2-polyprenyl-3-methyl-5-hydroxy-6-metoxy-1,4-benzoquinol methylase
MQTPSTGHEHVVAPEVARDAAAVTKCQLCGSEGREERFRDGPFSVVGCSDCGLVYVTPRLVGQALLDVYDEGYWKSNNPKERGYADYKKEAALYLKTFERRMRLVGRWLRPGARILDVGCAAGYFLRVAQTRGHDVHGVELSQAIAVEAVSHLGADRVHIGTLDDAVRAMDYRPESFDLITMWDVIEHIPEPQPVVRRIRELLKPDGRFLLETQNVASRWARLLGRRWHHYKHDEHLYHFDPATIRRILGDCGFAVEHLGAGYAGKYVSFGFLAERAQRLGRIAGLLARPLALLRACSVYVNPHDEMIVVAKKA